MKDHREIMEALRKSCKGKKVDALLHDLSEIIYELETTKECGLCNGGKEECDQCNGSGMMDCADCDGSGRVSC